MTRPTDIPLKSLKAHPQNRHVDTLSEDFAALKANIKARIDAGSQPLITMPVVRALGKEGRYQILCGHRRIAALRELGVKSIPCEVRKLDDARAADLLLMDNLHRADLLGVDILEAVCQMKLRGMDNSAIGEAFGRSKKWVANIYTLRELPEDVLEQSRADGHGIRELFKLHAQLQKPHHQAVSSVVPPDVQVVRGWSLKPCEGGDKLLKIRLKTSEGVSLAQVLAHLGLR